MEQRSVVNAEGGLKVEKRDSWKEKEKKKIEWPLAMIIITLVVCSYMLLITMFVSTNPFEISFKSDSNVVEITDNFRQMSESIARAEGDLVVCETKLSLYNKSYGDLWGEI